jgi:hypothetical protein
MRRRPCAAACPRQQLDAELGGPCGEGARILALALDQQSPAGLDVIVDEHDVGARRGRAQGGADPRDPASDHQHVAVPPTVLGLAFALGLSTRQPSQSRRRAQHPLVERPQAPRPDERLVVEADRGERSADAVDCAHDVEVERGPGVLVLDHHPVAHGLATGAHAGESVCRHERVGALPAPAQLAPGTVVLERAREHVPARCEQRRRDRVADKGRHRLAVEGERDRPRAVDPLVTLWV